jgi:hypothetical protein
MTTETEESPFITWAETELRRAGMFDSDSDYGGMLGEEVLKLCKTFSDANHSGYSAIAAASIFQTLSHRRPLGPLTNDPDEWMHIDEDAAGEPNLWQSLRCSACFSHDGGKTYYDIDERMSKLRKFVHRVTHKRCAKMHKSVSANPHASHLA